MERLVFVFKKDNPPMFGALFNTLEHAESCANRLWPNKPHGWHARFEMEFRNMKLRVWKPNTELETEYCFFDWSRSDCKRFLNECRIINGSVIFFHATIAKRQSKELSPIRVAPNLYWRIFITNIDFVNNTPRMDLEIEKS